MADTIHERLGVHLPLVLRRLLPGLCLCLLCSSQTRAQRSEDARRKSLPFVLLSDLHLDPLQDPAKVAELAKSPVEQWERILSSTPSPNRGERFAAVQVGCSGKEGADASFGLMRSALGAARKVSANAAFVIVAGDLLVHDLDCRYRFSIGLPAAKKDDHSVSAAFAEKTAVFVMTQLASAFPRIPVYIALGNNDSRCNHNRFDMHDALFHETAPAILNGMRGLSGEAKASIRKTYESAGYYAVTMPGGMNRLRLIVVNDTFMMPTFASCEGNTDDRQGALEQMAWLQRELDSARENKQPVWILSHLPTAIVPGKASSDASSTCSASAVTTYQRSPDFENLLAKNSDTVKLSLAGHTHADEFHLLPSKQGGIPIKVIGSVTPVAGSTPSFTIGFVDPISATLTDFDVYKAGESTNGEVGWTLEYAFDSTYSVTDFTASSLSTLIPRFLAEPTMAGPLTKKLEEHLLKGSTIKRLPKPFRSYLCTLDTVDPAVYTRCTCGTAPNEPVSGKGVPPLLPGTTPLP